MLHIRSLGSAKIISLDVESVREKLRKVAHNLTEQDENVLSVWLFGSLARGDALPGSDADILIVLNDVQSIGGRRTLMFCRRFSESAFPSRCFELTTFPLVCEKTPNFPSSKSASVRVAAGFWA